MNREDIIRMAQETGVTAERVRDLVNFAALVASAESEACAKVCDEHCEWTPRMIGATIRSRGNT